MNIVLGLQLFDGATGKTVKASLIDDTNIEFAVVTLPHVANGFYRATYVMPNTYQVRAVYLVYDLPGDILPSPTYSYTLDVFFRDFPTGTCKQGDGLRINLQLFDGSQVMYPRAFVYDVNGLLSATVLLTHIAHGLYADNGSFAMPNQAGIQIAYRVFEDLAGTIPSSVYASSLDYVAKLALNVDPGEANVAQGVTYWINDQALVGLLSVTGVTNILDKQTLTGQGGTSGVLTG